MTITDELLLECLEKDPKNGVRQAGQFKHTRRSLPPKQQGLGATEELSQRRSPAGRQPVIEGCEELKFALRDQQIPGDRRRGRNCRRKTRINRMFLELSN